MDFQHLLAMMGMGELLVDDFFAAQIGILVVTALLFLASLVLCLQAFRAAGAARNAHAEIAQNAQSVESLTAEMRQLAVKVEENAARFAAPEHPAVSDENTPVIGAGDIALRDGDRVESAAGETRELEAAKRAAAVPSALLRGILRRR